MFLFISFVLLVFLINLRQIDTLEKLSTREELQNEIENVTKSEDTLIYAHILLRHGERTPNAISTYSTDPNKYASYFPVGTAHLTKKGMLSAYKLGLELRQRYDHFLGDIYYPDLIGALSSPKPRCQNTLQCLFLSLFPPRKEELFVENFQWRPVHYDILPASEDDVFTIFDCNNFWNISSTITNQTVLDLFKILSNYTGDEVRNYSSVFLMKQTLIGSGQVGKPQPSWLPTIFPEPLSSVAGMFYYDMLEQKLKLGAAGFFKRLINDVINKLNGRLSPPRRKMTLYSGHEQNIVFALGAIDAYNGEMPKVTSYLVFEVHYIFQKYGFKVYFQNHDGKGIRPVNIFKQGNFCSLDVFIEKTRWLFEEPKPECIKLYPDNS